MEKREQWMKELEEKIEMHNKMNAKHQELTFAIERLKKDIVFIQGKLSAFDELKNDIEPNVNEK